jgi:two-component system, NarL family, sensor histidine kinase DesK
MLEQTKSGGFIPTGKCPHSFDWWDFVWIIYSVFFFIEPFSRHDTRYWIQFGIVYTIFVAIYTGLVVYPSRRHSYLLLIALGLLALYYYPRNQGASGMFVFVAAFVPFVTASLTASALTITATCAAILTEALYYHFNPYSWGFPLGFSIAVGCTNIFMAQRIRANFKLQMAQEEIEQLAKLAERERIARDLHDVLGHTLSVIVLKSELAGRLFSRNPERAAAEIADVEHIAREALTEVREAIRGYRAEGLAAEVRRAQSVLDAAGVTLACHDIPPALSPTEESVLSLVLREAVTNIVRHAQASHCTLRFEETDGQTLLVVEDDGRGGVREDGNGVRGMRERIEALGGHFAVNAANGAGQHGTRLTIQIPASHLPASAAELNPA